MNIEKRLEIVNEGKLTALAAQQLSGIIDQQLVKKLQEMSQTYRSGKTDQASLIALVAGYCALEDLKAEMIKRIRAGERASGELMKGEINE
jgi:hypothetical protein